MTRSLFFSFFLRLTAAMALVLAIHLWLRSSHWWLTVLFVLAFASVNAWMLARSVRGSILPLQHSAATLAQRQTESTGVHGVLGAQMVDRVTDQRYSDFDALARGIARAMREVQASLAIADSSRNEMEAMIDSLQDAVVSVDPAGRIQWTSQRMVRLFSPATGTIRTGHPLVQTIRDPDVLACVRTALDQHTFSQRRTTLLIPGRILEVNASPMPSGGAVLLFHDVTRMEQVERTQRDFVANVSHELRTPLTSISGYVETLLEFEQSISVQARGFLEIILKNATRMNRLTEDLLTMARVESASQQLYPKPFRADVLVHEVIQSVKGIAQDADVEIDAVHLLSQCVMADHDAVVQILMNLLENAIKYGREGSKQRSRVVVSTKIVSQPVDAVEFAVQDFGAGIASEHLPRLFERFYRVDKARSVETGGTGLGLAIAQYMVQAQGGTIRAESELNRGSRFFFTLPLASPLAELPQP